ncbi:MAG TPA: polysaccharide deacetylase family protein [Rhizomicrobium sp.]|jgi:hypothetical protein
MGCSPRDRLLIVNCDDLGSSRSANMAIERALREGSATSASLMVPCPWARAATAACRDLDIGIHLTLSSEYPAYRWRSLTGASSLHDRDGYLPATAHEVWARADLDDVERECRAQIDRALDWGVDITHVNSHMEVLQLDRRYFDLYMKIARSYGLPLRLSRPASFWPFAYMSRATLERAGVVVADNYFAPPWGEPARDGLMERVGRLSRGVTEVSLHPVEDGEELRAYDTEYAELRAADADCLMDKSLAELIQANAVRSIGFRPLREAMRAAG